MPQDNITKQLIINQLTKEQYSELVNTSQLSNSELYVITDDNHYTEAEIITLLSTKQDKLVVGEGVKITEDNIITIDLTNIYTKDELDGKLADKADLVASGYSIIYEDEKLTLKNILGEEISSVIIKSVPKTDDITINFNEQNQIQSIGEITKNGQPKYTWIGTQEEYNRDFESGIIDEYTECLITDTEAEGITPIVQFEAPTKLSDLANDMDFTTNAVVQEIKSELENKIDTKIDDTNLVHKTGTEVINGFKTFTEEITIQNGGTKGRISHKNTTSKTPSITDGYIEFGENTLKYGKESEQGLLYHKENDIFHSGNLIAGDNIAITHSNGVYKINGQAGGGGGAGGTTVFVDDETIVKDEQQVITTVGVKSKNDTILYDWVGTLEEYNSGVADGSIQPNWICWVTDDTTNDFDFDFDKQANTDLSNLSEVGEKHFLNKQQITNCITEIPQRIKLDLTDGVVTLKAGSTVIVPSGFEEDGVTPKFDYITIENDLTYGSSGAAGITYEYFLFYNITNKALGVRICTSCVSGTTAPNYTTYLGWYDTNENKIKNSNNSGSTWDTYLSLPVAQMSAIDGTWTKIKQVFNGFGFIGSTIWLDKGVKYLVPNGRNEDGSLRNIEIIKPKILIRNVASNANGLYKYVLGSDNNIYFGSGWYYDNETNYNRTADGKISLVLAQNAEIVCDNGKITSLEIKQPFRAADDQEVIKKSGDTMTGNLIISRNTASVIECQNVNMDYTSTEAPSSNTYCGGMTFYDKNHKPLGVFRNRINTSGTVQTQMSANRSINGTDYTASVVVGVDTNGNQLCTFPMCTTKATTTSSASTAKVAVVVQNYVSGASWYRVWSDGWKEQGGYVAGSTTADKTYTVTFLKSFSNANYTVQINPRVVNNTTTPQIRHIGYYTKAASNFTFCMPANTYVTGSDWYACGY